MSLLLEQLPNSAEIPSLLKNVSDLGKESGLDFLKFAPSGEARKDFYAEIPVSIVVNGDYHSFAQFADKVSHYPRIVNLSNIVFASPRPASGNLRPLHRQLHGDDLPLPGSGPPRRMPRNRQDKGKAK